MAEYINRETILDDLDIDIKVTNKERLLAKERHCVEDRMRYAKKLDHLRGFREYIKNLSTANVVEQEKIDKAIEKIVAKSYNEADTYPEYIDGSECGDILIIELKDVLEVLSTI